MLLKCKKDGKMTNCQVFLIYSPVNSSKYLETCFSSHIFVIQLFVDLEVIMTYSHGLSGICSSRVIVAILKEL